VEQVRALVPDGLEIEEFDGSAWVGVVPFRLTALRARGLPPLPGTSSFLELNVRTYVRAEDGKPGVWFFSLDATNQFAVQAARRTYRLPYFDARMKLADYDGRIDVECARSGVNGKVFLGAFRPTGEPDVAAAGSLEWFLAERYCLYAENDDALYRAEIHHAPWVLRTAEAEIGVNSIAPFDLEGPAVCHIAERQDVLVWPLERLSL
jgi:hypothetical protein